MGRDTLTLFSNIYSALAKGAREIRLPDEKGGIDKGVQAYALRYERAAYARFGAETYTLLHGVPRSSPNVSHAASLLAIPDELTKEQIAKHLNDHKWRYHLADADYDRVFLDRSSVFYAGMKELLLDSDFFKKDVDTGHALYLVPGMIVRTEKTAAYLADGVEKLLTPSASSDKCRVA